MLTGQEEHQSGTGRMIKDEGYEKKKAKIWEKQTGKERGAKKITTWSNKGTKAKKLKRHIAGISNSATNKKGEGGREKKDQEESFKNNGKLQRAKKTRVGRKGL